MAKIVYEGNDNILELNGFKDEAAGSFLNSATVTAEIFALDKTTSVVSSQAMAYVTSSDGIYRVTLADTDSLVAGTEYYAFIDANGGAGLEGHWEIRFIVKTRTD